MNTNYPFSLVRKIESLERVIKHLNEIISEKDLLLHQQAWDMTIMKEHLSNDPLDIGTWFWQNDGYDHLGSMRNQQGILISAEDLKFLLKHGEIILD